MPKPGKPITAQHAAKMILAILGRLSEEEKARVLAAVNALSS